MAAAALMATGCVNWAYRLDPKKAVLERERYGATADQRITELRADAEKAKKGGGEAIDTFTQRLTTLMPAEHDPRVRKAILDVAAGFDTPTAVAVCKGALEDPDERVRSKACEVWGRRGGPEAVALLTARYDTDASIDVRLEALKELGKLGDEAAIPTLARALENADPAVQYRAVTSLKKVSGRDLGDDVNLWRAWAADPKAPGTEWTVAEEFRKLY
jgi:HEAT repeat protein